MTFQDLGLCPQILSALGDMGYEKPSPIQEKAIPPALQGRDVLGCAQTGTGKTCAFATPILQQLNARKAEPFHGVRPIRALILTPTRELALQIQESFEAYGKNLPLRSAVIFGGVGQQPQVDALKRGVDILVATPGRLEDLHDQGYIHVENLEIFVLDEADRMLDMGFIHDVKKILKWIPQKKQTLFFSATMPPEVQHLVDSLLVDPVKVAVDPVSSPVEVIDQRLFYVDRGNKSKLLALLVKHPDVKNALVFTRTKHGANKVAGDLEKAGIHAAAIHGNKSQTARQQALSDFKAGRIKALVATDIAARGLDIEELSHVFNYNLPDVPETYVHRIGRTGRAGHGGTAVSFCEFGEKELLAPIEKLLKKPIPVVEGHPYPMEVFEAPKRDKHGKIVNPDDQEARQAARERKKLREEAGALRDAKRPGGSPRSDDRDSRLPKGQMTSHRTKSHHPASVGCDAAPPAVPVKKTAQKGDGSSSRDAAFEAWLAEERRIQAQQARQYGHDPLAGEEIMDSTARLLAPRALRKEASYEAKRPAGSPRSDDRDSRLPKGQMTSHKTQSHRTTIAGRDDVPTGTPKPRPVRQTAKKDPMGGKNPEKREKRPQKQAPAETAAKRAKPVAPQRPKRSDRPDRLRRGPMEPPRSATAQRDSTEQKSLMKPYYFNPNGD